MSHDKDLSHRQEREQKKHDHAGSTPAKYPRSKVGWGLAVGIVVVAAAVLVWTFVILPMRVPG